MKSIIRKLGIPVACIWVSLVGSISPGVSQIPVTGGRITGQAGFFVPNLGNTRFFDFGTQTLKLETPNGVTVDSRFIPSSASLNPIGNRLPTIGDGGTIQGLLSGRAFDLGGSPFFFSNIATQLNFVTNSFLPVNGALAGSLITSPNSSGGTTTPQLFLPVLGVTLDPISALTFAVQPGVLAVGQFDANLPSGIVSLPSTARFGTPLMSEFAIPDVVILNERRFNFRLEGQGIPNVVGTVGDPEGSYFDPFFAGGVRFSSSNAVTNFSLQIDGTNLGISGSGNFGTAILIQGITPASSSSSPILPGNLTPIVQYSVVGQGSGIAENVDPVRFTSTNSATVFSFRDSSGAFAQGVSAGTTAFVIAGAKPFTVSSFTNLTPTADTSSVDIVNTGAFTPAIVLPPPSLVGSGGGQPSNGSITPGNQSPVTTVPTQTFVIPQVISTSGSGPFVNSNVPFVTIQNPSLPDSSTFPGLNVVQVPFTSTISGNDSAQKLFTGQNLSAAEILALTAPGGLIPTVTSLPSGSFSNVDPFSLANIRTNFTIPGVDPNELANNWQFISDPEQRWQALLRDSERRLNSLDNPVGQGNLAIRASLGNSTLSGAVQNGLAQKILLETSANVPGAKAALEKAGIRF